MDPGVLPASRVPPEPQPLSPDTSMSQAASRDGASSLQGGHKKGPHPQKAILVGRKAPHPHSKVGPSRGKQGRKEPKAAGREENREGERRAPAAQHGDPLPETEAAEEEDGERAKAASRCGDGRFFHMAATPRYGRPSPIPAAYK